MDQRVPETINEMLASRGFSRLTIIDDLTFADNDDTGDALCIFYMTNEKFNVDCIQEYIKVLTDLKLNHAIIVYKGSVTPCAKKMIQELKEFQLELFLEKELLFNLTKHRLVPIHEVLARNESEQFKKQYGTRIPILLRSDPVCRFYNFKFGDVVRVIRNNGFVCFRLVK